MSRKVYRTGCQAFRGPTEPLAVAFLDSDLREVEFQLSKVAEAPCPTGIVLPPAPEPAGERGDRHDACCVSARDQVRTAREFCALWGIGVQVLPKRLRHSEELRRSGLAARYDGEPGSSGLAWASWM